MKSCHQNKIFLFGWAFVFLFLCGKSVTAQNETGRGYNLKAAFLYNFIQYIDWGSSGNSNEFIIGIVGASPIKEQIEELFETKTIGSKKIIIRQFNSPNEIIFCHILFIPENTMFPLSS